MSSFALKLIAVFSMLFDHILKILPVQELLLSCFGIPFSASKIFLFPLLLSGRFAFPIFAFLVSEGCKHTRNPGNYLLRLLLFAALSEVPFQLAFLGGVSLSLNNVFFTLAAGAAACFAYRCLSKKVNPALALFCVLPFSILTWLLGTDYGNFGVLIIFIAYIAPSTKTMLLGMGACLSFFSLLSMNYIPLQLFLPENQGLICLLLASLCALIFIGLYSGKRGRQLKWMFYVFYPAHLLLLVGLRELLA